MTTPINTPQPRKRRPLAWILGGCGILSLCIVLALAANALYWTGKLSEVRAAGPTSAPGEIESKVSSLPAGDASRGGALFQNDCQGCHSLEPGERKVGPSLAGVDERAGSTKPGFSAQMYLYESITAPQAYTVAGFPPGVMPTEYASRLSSQQLADLLAFLMAR